MCRVAASSLGLIATVTSIVGAAAAADVGDFSNDLPADLAPLLQLFGEPVTKQYLSEATTFIDYFIFAMAPIGTLTAIVSVIRVCGDASFLAGFYRPCPGGWGLSLGRIVYFHKPVCV